MSTNVFLAPTPILQFFNNAGLPNAGGSVLTQVGGVNYPTYQDSSGNTQLPNPIPLNSRGEISNTSGVSCQLFLAAGTTYVFTMYDANGNQIDQATWVGFSGVSGSDYSQGYLLRIVDSVSALRSLSNSIYTRVKTTSYYGNGAGSGYYWYNAGDTTSTDNGFTIIVALNGARWYLETGNVFNFLQAGAVADFNGSTGTDNSANMVSASSVTSQLYIPDGSFLITTLNALNAFKSMNVYGPGRIFYNNGTRIVQLGQYKRAGVANNAADNATGFNNTTSSSMLSGGILIGGEGPGTDGVLLWGQQPSWMQVQTTKAGADTEFQIYTGAYIGVGVTVSGSNVLNATYNNFSSSKIEVGDIIGIGNQEYMIASKPNGTQITVTTVVGGSVVFPANTTVTWRHCYDYANGVCNVSGTSVSWVSGDYFFGIYDPYPSQNVLEIGGTKYVVTSYNNITSLTLASSPGSGSNVTFQQKSYQSNLSTVRMQGLAGGNEEAYALYNTTYGDCFLETQYAGSGQYNSIRVRTGPEYDYGYSRDHLNISPNGQIGIGKEYVSPNVGFPNSSKVFVWRQSTVAQVTNGTSDMKMFTIDSISQGVAPRQLTLGFFNNFNCGYIQGYQDSAGVTPGDIVIQPKGGNLRVGGSTTSFSPNTLSVGGIISHSIDNTYSFGSASYRASVVYAATGSINTSDRDTKSDIGSIPDAVLDAWSEVNFCQFKFDESIQRKGDKARFHIGLVAQDIKEAFERHNLDATQYGLLCYDEWQDIYEDVMQSVEDPDVIDSQTGEHGKKLVPTGEKQLVQAGGSRWGIRADECQFLEMALMRRTISKLNPKP